MKRFIKQLIIVLFMSKGLYAVNSLARAILIDNNGKILLGGQADNPLDGSTNFALARYNQDGTADTTFNPGGVLGIQSDAGQLNFPIQGTNEAINAFALDANNKIVAVGYTTSTPAVSLVAPVTSIAIARFNEDGSLDQTFNPANLLNRLPGIPGTAIIEVSPFNDVATGVAIDSLNRIVIGGNTNNTANQDVVVIRLLNTGELDITFDTGEDTDLIRTIRPGIIAVNVQETTDAATAIAVDDVNSIYVGGWSDNGINTDFLIIKLLETGSLDTTFNPFSLNPGIVLEDIRETEDKAFALRLDSEKRIVIGGFSNNGLTTDFALMRFTPDGALDPTFNEPGVTTRPGIVVTAISQNDDQINGLAFDANNRIVVTGFSNNTANSIFATARYNIDGSLDQTFVNNTSPFPGVVINNVVFSNSTARNNNNGAYGVAIINNNDVVVTGFSNDALQINFTTLYYLETGFLNINGFNAFFQEPGIPGIVLTVFSQQDQLRGNGVPLFLVPNTAFIEPTILQDIQFPVVPIAPSFETPEPFITNELQPVMEGSSTANAIINLFLDGNHASTALADNDGIWAATLPPLPDGTYQVTAVSYDPLTGLTLASDPRTVKILREAPPIPIIQVPAQEEIIKQLPFFVRGTAKPETLIELYVNNEFLADGETNNAGVWSIEVPELAAGEYELFVRAIDAAGNVSESSDSLFITLDLGTSEVPVITTPSNKSIIKERRVTIEGKGTSNSRIKLFINEQLIASLPVDKQGIWTYTHTLKDGEHTIYATTNDNRLSSEKIRITVDTKVPREALIANGNGKGLINGIAEPDSLITVFSDERLLGTTHADRKGDWSFTPRYDQKIPSGTHQIRIQVTDGAGHSSFVEKQLVL